MSVTAVAHRRVLVIGLLICVAISARGAVASAAPGWEQLGGPALRLGLEEEAEPTSVVHRGELYTAVIERANGRELLVVDRIGEDRRPQRVGLPLNVVGAGVHRPVLLSAGGVLYAVWIEGDHAAGNLRIARLAELPNRTVRWEAAVEGDGPQADPAAGLQVVAFRDRPAVLYVRPGGGFRLALALEDGWGFARVGDLVPDLADVTGVAVYGSSIYVAHRETVALAGLPDSASGPIPPNELWRWRIERIVLDADGHFERVDTIHLPDAIRASELVIEGRHGERPLIAYADGRGVTVAELNDGQTDIRTLGRLFVRDRLPGLWITRSEGNIAVATRDGAGLVLYRLIGGDATHGEPIPLENPRNVTLVTGPAGQPVLTYTNGLHTAILGYTRGGPSR